MHLFLYYIERSPVIKIILNSDTINLATWSTWNCLYSKSLIGTLKFGTKLQPRSQILFESLHLPLKRIHELNNYLLKGSSFTQRKPPVRNRKKRRRTIHTDTFLWKECNWERREKVYKIKKENGKRAINKRKKTNTDNDFTAEEVFWYG